MARVEFDDFNDIPGTFYCPNCDKQLYIAIDENTSSFVCPHCNVEVELELL